MYDGTAVRNTWHFRRNPSAGSVEGGWLGDLLASSGTTSLKNAYLAALDTGATLDGILARATRDPLNPGDDRDEKFLAVAAPGTRSPGSTRCPQAICALMKVSGDRAGRRYRGRNFMPPAADRGEILNNVFLAANPYLVALNAFKTELAKTTYASGAGHYSGAWNDCDLIVFSRKGRQASGTYYARVPAIDIRPQIHWLRSRMPQA